MTSLFDLPFEEPTPDRAAEPTRRDLRRVFTVSELTAQIRGLLEARFVEVWVEGEISNCRIWNTGHAYFTLKDGGAQIRAVLFRSTLRGLRFKPQDGVRVVARGRIGVYDAKGEYQLVCEHLAPEGLGARQLAFDQLKQRLAAEGLFDARRKRPLPALPRTIGVVTSLDGAAVRDIIKVLQQRHPNLRVVVRPARVQGEGAALDIARGLSAIGRVQGLDVVIVGRGGGSVEDLWAFNEEVVARAIAGCPVPVISAVGHETDVTMADFVADVRAATPSAAAELVVGRRDEVGGRIDRLTHRMYAAVRMRRHRLETRVRTLESRPGYAGLHARVVMRGRHVTDLTQALGRVLRARVAARARVVRSLRAALDSVDMRRRLPRMRTRLVAADHQLLAALDGVRHEAGRRVREAAARLDMLSPLAVLGRGYAVCWNADRTAVVRDAASVPVGERVRVTLQRGEIECAVTRARASVTDE